VLFVSVLLHTNNNDSKSGVYPSVILVSLSGSGKTYFWFELAKNKGKIPIPFIITAPMRKAFTKLQIAKSDYDDTKLAFFEGYITYLLYMAHYLSQQPSFQPVDFVVYMLNSGAAHLGQLYEDYEVYTKIGDIPHVPEPDVRKYLLVVDEARTIANALPMTIAELTGNALTALNRVARIYVPIVFASTYVSKAEIASLVSGTADNRGATTEWYKPLPLLNASNVLEFINKFVYINPDLETLKLVSFLLQGRMRYVELFIKSMHAELTDSKMKYANMSAIQLLKRHVQFCKF